MDSQPPVTGRTSGAFTQLTLPQNLFLGGVADYDAVSSALFLKDGFQGCIQKVGGIAGVFCVSLRSQI